jgi:protease-4
MFKKVLAGFLFGLLFLFLFLVAGFYLLTRETAPSVPEGSYLILRMEGELPEDAPRDFWTQLFEGRPVTVFDVVRSLRNARDDDRIDGVIVRVGLLAAGYGKVQEVRGALDDFQSSGKRVIAYVEIARDLEYYLATAADEIYMAPVSALMTDGIVGSALFVRGTFDKIGVRPNFVRIGDYKTAVDLFTSREMSEAQRWEINSLLDSIFERYVADVAAARGFSVERFRAIIDEGMLDSRDALERGLVDDLLYPNQLREKLTGETGEFLGVDVETYRDVEPPGAGDRSRFAFIVADGSITLGESGDSPDFGRIAGSSTLNGAIREALLDDEIEAIILRINSPGGVWVASDQIWGELVRAMEEKPVVVSMSDVAASGGYYIAMPADAIVAEPGTITGSIGVYAGKFNVSGLYEKVGLAKESIARGEYAQIFSETRDFTEAERDRLFENLWEFYMNDFVRKASEGRSIPPDSLDNMARGKVWTGEQALALGLVDTLGGLWAAVEIAKDLAEIPPEEEITLVPLPRPQPLLQRLLEGDLILDAPAVSFDPRLDEVVEATRRVNLLASGRVMAMMPFRIEFE